MAEREQNFKNHTRWLPPFHYFVLPVLLVNVLNAGRHVYLSPNRSTAFALVVALALMMLAGLARQMAVAVQDRVIRLEMQLRLKQVLPADLQARAASLTPKQLVALRFAGNDELPALTRDVLDGKLQSQKAIKLAITHWQADWFRV
jgi:Family of unknown function (DUF6526)